MVTTHRQLSLLISISLTALISNISTAASPNSKKTKSSFTSSTSFEKHIQPIFAEHCVQCHGPDKAKANLRLTSRPEALAKLKSGKFAITPGKPHTSQLLARITSTDTEKRMPPKGDPLTPAQIKHLRNWITSGAKWQKHWAYRAITNPPTPILKNNWPRHNAIDNFIQQTLLTNNMTPSDPASRHTLIKRLAYTLTGLPPTPKEVDNFVNDKSSDAYRKLVDRLLASPHFGERWARHWLDKARYADSDGYEKDRPRPNAWRYRDWVINAVNGDLPYNQFIIQQTAGDLLPNATPQMRLATAFHRQTLTNTEGGTDKEEFRVAAVVDRVNTTGAVFLGLTLVCAQCHDHKYDTVSTKEYYQLYAFLNNGDETNTSVLRSASDYENYLLAKARHDKKIASHKSKLDVYLKSLKPKLPQLEAKLQTTIQTQKNTKPAYHPLNISSIASASKVKYKPLPDGSHLATGNIPNTEKLTLTATTNIKSITAVKIEALTHPSFPKRGPGRAANGNFVLSHFRAYAAPSSKFNAKAHRLQFASAKSSFNQRNFPATAALKGKSRFGWAVSPQLGKNHQIIFYLKRPLNIKSPTTHLQFVLDQQHGTRHTIGRFRITLMTGTPPRIQIPKSIRDTLALAPAKRSSVQSDALTRYLAQSADGYKEVQAELIALQKSPPRPPNITVRVITQRTRNPRVTRILNRGDFLSPADVVTPGTLSQLHPLKPRNPKQIPDRLDLANWLASPQNPLTPRVTVNQVWRHLFGVGLVKTVNDFGIRGSRPTHPKLLDHLATTFIRQNWSLKKLIRYVVTSHTFRQSSVHRTHYASTDPNNRLLYRQNRVRVEAEIIRDIALSASGLLSTKTGGPSVFPPLPPDVAALSYANNFKWNTSKGPDRFRRGMYTFFKRTSPHPNLITFDCPDSNTTNVDRTTSNTPLMALTTLNNITFIEAAQAMSGRILTAKLNSDSNRLTLLFRLCVARPPTPAELVHLTTLLQKSRAHFKTKPEDAKNLTGKYTTPNTPVGESAAWTAVARIVLNLDEFLTRE